MRLFLFHYKTTSLLVLIISIRQKVDRIDFLEVANLICFLLKKQIKFATSKDPICQIYFLTDVLNKKKPPLLVASKVE